MASSKLYFALLAFSVFSSSNGFIRMPLKRHISQQRQHYSSSGKPFTVGASLDYNLGFLTTVKVGDQGQEFNLLLDTGSSSVVLASTECGDNCGQHAQYSCPGPQEGTSALVYGTGSADDIVCSDSLTIGGHKIKNQILNLATSEDSDMQNETFDGIIGLSYTSESTYISNTGDMMSAPTVVDNLAAQHGLRKIYSTYLTLQPNGEGSFILFGGSDKDYYRGDLQYVPVAVDPPVSLQIQSSFKFGDDTLVETIPVAIDTGTNRLVVPEKILNKFTEILESLGLEEVIDCSELDNIPPLQMQAGNVLLQLEAKYFFTQPNSDGLCQSYVDNYQGTSFDPNLIIMGIPFFQKYYVEFDLEENRIGFAENKKSIS